LHEVGDPYYKYETGSDLKAIKIYFISISMTVAMGFLILTTIHKLFSAFLEVTFNMLLMMYIYSHPNLSNYILAYAAFTSVIGIFLAIFLAHKYEQSYKKLFMSTFKINRILDEQKVLLDNISDGAMIYRLDENISNEDIEDGS
jgi:hypothetical protein